jgi:hypothetical protein
MPNCSRLNNNGTACGNFSMKGKTYCRAHQDFKLNQVSIARRSSVKKTSSKKPSVKKTSSKKPSVKKQSFRDRQAERMELEEIARPIMEKLKKINEKMKKDEEWTTNYFAKKEAKLSGKKQSTKKSSSRDRQAERMELEEIARPSMEQLKKVNEKIKEHMEWNAKHFAKKDARK